MNNHAGGAPETWGQVVGSTQGEVGSTMSALTERAQTLRLGHKQ